MCMYKSLKHYPPPNKSKKVYVKPVPYPIEKSKKIDDEIESILKMVSTDTIKSWVLKISSYHTRHSKSKYIHDVADWLRSEFVSMGYDDVDFHTYTENIDGHSYDLQNVYCNKNGINDKRILICAHYDSRMKNLGDSESRAPGANDNASGVSAILEIVVSLKTTVWSILCNLYYFQARSRAYWVQSIMQNLSRTITSIFID